MGIRASSVSPLRLVTGVPLTAMDGEMQAAPSLTARPSPARDRPLKTPA
jgi:hypothetical protein